MKNIFLPILLYLFIPTIFSQNLGFEIDNEEVTIKSYSQSEFEDSDYYSSNNVFSQGIEIISETNSVNIFFNGLIYNTSYKTFNNIPAGNYYIEIRRSGYKTVSRWITLEENRRIILTVNLAREYGYLKVDSNVKNLEIYIENRKIESETILPTGRYKIKIRSFGYEDTNKYIIIKNNKLTHEVFNLVKADFDITSFSLEKEIYNTNSREGFGTNSFSIGVNGPGSGLLSIKDSDNNIIFSTNITFSKWFHTVEFNKKLIDGVYKVTIISEDIIMDKSFIIDSTIRERNLPSFNLNTGLLLTPTAEINPVKLSQYQFNTGYQLKESEFNVAFYTHTAPISFLSIHGGINVDIDIDDNISNFELGAGTMFLKDFKKANTSFNLNYLFTAKLKESGNRIDHALEINTPTTLKISNFNLSLTPGVIYLIQDDFRYSLSAGFHYDNQKIRSGLSTKVVSLDFTEYSTFYAYEFHYLLPNSQSYIGLSIGLDNTLSTEIKLTISTLD